MAGIFGNNKYDKQIEHEIFHHCNVKPYYCGPCNEEFDEDEVDQNAAGFDCCPICGRQFDEDGGTE